MKQLKFITTVALALMTLIGNAQTPVYATDLNDKKIVKTSVTGTTASNFSQVQDNLPGSAALGADANGYLWYLVYGDNATGEGDGKVDIYRIKTDGTGNTKIYDNVDVNASSTKDLGFVRLGIDANGLGWIVASESSTNKIYLAKFKTTSPYTFTAVTGNINTSDADNALFKNGDLAFTYTGTMLVLANDDASDRTKVYTINPSTVAINGAGTLVYKWTVKKDDGSSFTSRVNGAAFSPTGSMYFSTDEGLYFLDQNSTNFAGTGTVKASFIKGYTGLTDLATAIWPVTTSLPIKFKSFTATRSSDNILTVLFTIESNINTDHFNIEVSKNGKDFSTITVLFADAFKNNTPYVVKIDLNKASY